MVLSLRGKVNTEKERERETCRDDVGKIFIMYFVPHLKKPVFVPSIRRRRNPMEKIYWKFI